MEVGRKTRHQIVTSVFQKHSQQDEDILSKNISYLDIILRKNTKKKNRNRPTRGGYISQQLHRLIHCQ